MNRGKNYALNAPQAAKKYALSGLLAVGLAIFVGLAVLIGLGYNAIALEQGSPGNQVQQIHKATRDPQENNGQTQTETHSVPDAGSTAALLGLSVALVVFGQHKFAIVK